MSLFFLPPFPLPASAKSVSFPFSSFPLNSQREKAGPSSPNPYFFFNPPVRTAGRMIEKTKRTHPFETPSLFLFFFFLEGGGVLVDVSSLFLRFPPFLSTGCETIPPFFFSPPRFSFPLQAHKFGRMEDISWPTSPPPLFPFSFPFFYTKRTREFGRHRHALFFPFFFSFFFPLREKGHDHRLRIVPPLPFFFSLPPIIGEKDKMAATLSPFRTAWALEVLSFPSFFI